MLMSNGFQRIPENDEHDFALLGICIVLGHVEHLDTYRANLHRLKKQGYDVGFYERLATCLEAARNDLTGLGTPPAVGVSQIAGPSYSVGISAGPAS